MSTKKTKTIYPISKGSEVFYYDDDRKEKMGMVRELGLFPDNVIGILVNPYGEIRLEGEWITEDQLR